MENHIWILYVLCFSVLVPSDLSTSPFFSFSLHSRSLVFILLSEDLSYFLSREWTALACSLDVRKSASFLNFLF
jgi:hypothetical protein